MDKGVAGVVLIVDDDVHLQKAVKRSAEAAGYEVVQALDGATGLALASARSVDLVLLDIGLPLLDGRDVLKRLKENPSTSHIPVLVYSGRADETDRRLGLDLGAEDYIEKPFDVPTLLRKIKHMIEKARNPTG
jgi:DNA-binding response OmpR family regulator